MIEMTKRKPLMTWIEIVKKAIGLYGYFKDDRAFILYLERQTWAYEAYAKIVKEAMKEQRRIDRQEIDALKRTLKAKGKTPGKYITAIDPTLKRRVLFLVKNGWAISVITGYKFSYKE